MTDRPLSQHDPRHEIRHCDICNRDLAIDVLRPGWTVVRREGKPVWSCPGCSREQAKANHA